MFCPRCGEEILEGLSFCKKCGYKLSAHKREVTPEEEHPKKGVPKGPQEIIKQDRLSVGPNGEKAPPKKPVGLEGFPKRPSPKKQTPKKAEPSTTKPPKKVETPGKTPKEKKPPRNRKKVFVAAVAVVVIAAMVAGGLYLFVFRSSGGDITIEVVEGYLDSVQRMSASEAMEFVLPEQRETMNKELDSIFESIENINLKDLDYELEEVSESYARVRVRGSIEIKPKELTTVKKTIAPELDVPQSVYNLVKTEDGWFIIL